MQDKTRFTDLEANQSIVLCKLLISKSDTEAIKDLGWSNDKFYRYKKQVVHLKDEYMFDVLESVKTSLAFAGLLAVQKLIEILEDENVSNSLKFRVSGDILDRIGLPRQKVGGGKMVYCL